MLGFNKDNYRIGFGKGYYDRALRNYKGYKLGIAYSFQESDEIVVEEYDVVLDEIITE
jgi:5-formyltetrahydrofolate cyclo-ligase